MIDLFLVLMAFSVAKSLFAIAIIFLVWFFYKCYRRFFP